VVEREGREGPLGGRGDVAGGLDRVALDLGDVVEDRGVAQALVEDLAGGGVVDVDDVGDAVEGDPLRDAGEAEAVVAVEVGDADPGDRGGRHAGVDHLSLRALTGIEEEPLVVPAQQVAVVVAVAGRYLARGTEGDQFAGRQNATSWARSIPGFRPGGP
jgi:hypothetical protein